MGVHWDLFGMIIPQGVSQNEHAPPARQLGARSRRRPQRRAPLRGPPARSVLPDLTPCLTVAGRCRCSPFQVNMRSSLGHYPELRGICQAAAELGPSSIIGDRLGTDTRSLTPKRLPGANPPQPQTRLGHRPTSSPRASNRRPAAAGRVIAGGAWQPRRHGPQEHPALRVRPAGPQILRPVAHRPRAEGARHRPPR